MLSKKLNFEYFFHKGPPLHKFKFHKFVKIDLYDLMYRSIQTKFPNYYYRAVPSPQNPIFKTCYLSSFQYTTCRECKGLSKTNIHN